jgi:integrase
MAEDTRSSQIKTCTDPISSGHEHRRQHETQEGTVKPSRGGPGSRQHTKPGRSGLLQFPRFTGLRKDEANRFRWADINFDEGYFHCRGTKTDEADILAVGTRIERETKEAQGNKRVRVCFSRTI